MRVLFTTMGGAGHVEPLLPFARALQRAGHDVLVAVRRLQAESVAATGLPVWLLDDAPSEPRDAVFAAARGLSDDEANRRVVGDVFAGMDAAAALPGVRAAIALRRPDVLVHESTEFAGPLAAERAGVPRARVAITLAATEGKVMAAADAALAPMRAALGLPADPGPARVTEPLLTLAPRALEEPVAPGPARALRFRDDDELGEPLPDWWPGQGGPLVYLTFGSVAPTMPFFPEIYRAAIDALGGLPVRVLVTVGRAQDPAALGPLPANVHAERWIPQADVLPHASVIACHGGFGTVRSAVSAGVPLVVLPLFADQPYNARRVAAMGAGVALQEGPAAVPWLGGAVMRVLGDRRYAATAARVADEVRRLPPARAAVDVLAELAAGGQARRAA